ncbi:MAG TPA: DMT family transporter [Ilumatobacteraceae bacterium]|nr:DMT family transporter [Ilumatobacteraceae bacterium]
MTTAPVDAASAAAADAKDLSRGLIGAGIAVCAWSTGTILAKYIDMGSLAIGFYRFAFFGLMIVLWMRVRGVPFRLRIIRDSMWGGLALGADIALFFSAVKLTSVVNATIIGAMQPIVVGVIAATFFGEKIGLRNIAWSLVALTGTVVVVAASADGGTGDLRGDLLALGAMLTWSAYFIASKNSKKSMTSTEFTAGTALWTTAICFPLGFVFGQDMSWPSATNWGWLIVMAISSGLIGHAMMNWSLVRIPLWVGSTFTLLIPVFSALLAWVVLGEAVTVLQGVAMAVVIGALAVVVRNQSQPAPTIADTTPLA